MFAHRRSSRVLFLRLAVLCFLLVLTFNLPISGVANDDASASDFAVFRTSDNSYLELVQLDSATLADTPPSPSAGLDSAIVTPNVLISRDGRIVVGRDADWDVVVQLGLGSPVVSRFPLGGQGWLTALSEDGSKLLAAVGEYASTWKVFDTTTGKVLASYDFPWDRFRQAAVQVDPASWRMYALTRGEWNRHPVSPWLNRERQLRNGHFDLESGDPLAFWTTAPSLVAVDLNSGAEIGRAELPRAVVSAWLTDASVEAMARIISPGFALSPDGSELAIVDATDSGITLFDTMTLMAKASIVMTEKTSLADKLFSMLLLAPQTASAKGQAGVWRYAKYSVDGSHLYISGFESKIDDNFVPSYEGMGLSVVDLKDGSIEAQLFDGMEIYDLCELGNGTIFAVGSEFRADGLPALTVVARVDPGTQEIIASRSFKYLTEFLFVPKEEIEP